MLLLAATIYVAVGTVLVLAGAFKLVLKDAIRSPFAVEMLLVSGTSKFVIAAKLIVYRVIIYATYVALWPVVIFAEISLRRKFAE